jgi:hypothetical protein
VCRPYVEIVFCLLSGEYINKLMMRLRHKDRLTADQVAEINLHVLR